MRRACESPLVFATVCVLIAVLGFVLLDVLILQIPLSTR
jgi:hypothetical protein